MDHLGIVDSANDIDNTAILGALDYFYFPYTGVNNLAMEINLCLESELGDVTVGSRNCNPRRNFENLCGYIGRCNNQKRNV